MSFSPRKDIMAKVLERAALITTAHGYQTNLGSKLKRWHVTSLDPVQLDALIVNDGKFLKNADDANSGKHTWELEVFFNIVLGPSDTGAETATKAIEDVYKMIGVDQRWGGLARRTDEVSDEIRVDKEGTRVAGAQVAVKVITSRKPFEA